MDKNILAQTLRWLTLGFCPFQASTKVMPFKHLLGLLFFKYVVVATASTHILWIRPLLWSMHHAISTKVQLSLSAIPFDWRVYGAKNYCWMPLTLQWSLKAFEVNSTLLFSQTIFYLLLWTILHHSLELFKHY